MKCKLGCLCLMLALASCQKKEISSAQIVEDKDNGDLFVNFYDSSRPTVFASSDGTDIRGKSFHVIVQHKKGEYSGYMVKLNDADIALTGDESGDGLMNILISKNGVRWIGKWDISKGEPTVTFSRSD